MNPTTIQLVGAGLFALAVLHTFSTRFFDHLAHARPRHAGLWHLLGEVEAVFGFWATILIIFMSFTVSLDNAVEYLDTRDYTEPLFIFAVMVVAASRPIMQFTLGAVRLVSRAIPQAEPVAVYFTIMAMVPLLGSLITEPAAMTLAAMMLRERYYTKKLSRQLMYVTIGTLFVNISIGGTLTHFAAPPVLMVASTWGWDTWYMFSHFGWKAACAVIVNAGLATLIFRRQLLQLSMEDTAGSEPDPTSQKIPKTMVGIHLFLLSLIVTFSHHPPVFLGVFLLFMGIATAYPHYQDRLILREGLLVAFFLAGLIILGGLQGWWLEPLLAGMDTTTVFFGTTTLTAITDNAALTYLASQVNGLSEEFKYAVVSGAVAGGGLTVIANAPNPAGISLLRRHFKEGAVNPLRLLAAAIPPTLVAVLAFRLL